MTDYRFVGRNLDGLENGRQLEPGQFITLTDDEETANRRLLDEGLLIPVGTPAAVDATPGAVELADQNGIDLATVAGTGKDGRITQTDVETHIREQEEHA